jgi:hypothetical protein
LQAHQAASGNFWRIMDRYTFNIPQSAGGIPATAVVYSLNATVVLNQSLGYVTIWPAGETQPFVSSLNSYDGRIKANAAITAAGTDAESASTPPTRRSSFSISMATLNLPERVLGTSNSSRSLPAGSPIRAMLRGRWEGLR